MNAFGWVGLGLAALAALLFVLAGVSAWRQWPRHEDELAGVLATREGDVVEYCPYCGRGLVVFHRDGTVDLAPKAGVSAQVAVALSDLVAGGSYAAVPKRGSAFCERPACLRSSRREAAEA